VLRFTLSLGLVTFFLPIACLAQLNDETYIGTIHLKLGTAQRFVISELSKEYKVEDMSARSSSGARWYEVEDKDGTDRGAVFFKDNKLCAVNTTLFSESVRGDFPENLYAMTKSFIGDAGDQCEIATVSTDNNGTRARGVWYTCSNRKLKVMIVWDASGNETAAITEEVGTIE